MMDDFQHENLLWDAIQQQTDKTVQRQHIVELIALLLPRLHTDVFSTSIDNEELIDLLLEYQQIGEHTQHFLNTALPYLQTVEDVEVFAEQLATLQQQLQQINQQLQHIVDKAKQLQQQEKLLKQKARQLQRMKQQAQKIHQNTQQLQHYITQLQAQPSQLTQLIETLTPLHNEAVTAIWTIVPNIVQLMQENYSLYQQHTQANTDILQAMQHVPATTEIQPHLTQAQQLSQHLHTDLTHFDTLLRTMITLNETAQRQLSALREPS